MESMKVSRARKLRRGEKSKDCPSGIFGDTDVRVGSEFPVFLGWESPGFGHVCSCWYLRSPADVTERLDRLIEDIRSRFHGNAIGKGKGEAPASDVVLVAHGHILRAFSMRWIGRELTEGVSLLLEGMLSRIAIS